MKFVAIDLETANADMSSICQIGIARFDGGTLEEAWETLVDPEDYFDAVNVSIHGIDESVVAGAPTFRKVVDTVNGMLDNHVVVTHTHFDRVALHQVAQKYQTAQPTCTWLDSAMVARRTWKECASSGYGLGSVCKLIGYEFKHHDALEDAKAAASVLLAAMTQSGLDLDAWLKRVRQPIDSNSEGRIARASNTEGPLYGEVLAFTGQLEIPRREAADMAAKIGCEVEAGVTKKTTLLVVGDQDVSRLAGHSKSSKHRRAEELIEKGQPIRILRESDFRKLAELSP